MKPSNRSFWAAFGYAGRGVWHAFRQQRNLRVHVSIALVAVFLGWLVGLSGSQWCVIILVIGLVIGLELVNTSLETLTDLASPEYHPLAGAVKDVAAGAVLVAAAGALAVGLVVFLPQLGQLGEDFMVRWHQNPVSVWAALGLWVLGEAATWIVVPDRATHEGGQDRFGETH